MKTIKTIIAALLLVAGTAAQAQQVMVVKTDNGKDDFQLTSRLVLDLTGQKPVVRTNSQSMAYDAGKSLLMYLMSTSEESCQLIDDAASFYNPEDRFCKQITYTRDFQSLDWQLLYLPLRLKFDEWNNDFDIARINDVHQYDSNADGRIDVTELEVVLMRNGYTEPNTPYVIRARRTGIKTIVQNDATLYASEQIEKTVSSWDTDFTFHGTYTRLNASDVPAGTLYSVDSNSLGMSTADSQIGAFRWYITVTDRKTGQPATTIQKIRICDYSNDPDAISPTLSSSEEEGVIYDISGRRVSRPAKGIYIQNGRKIAVK